MADRNGQNLPDFQATQLDFAAHIRNPERHPQPADIEARRMKIYLDLFYNNIENFLASAFPVAKRLIEVATWHKLVRAFVEFHPSSSPYFLQISEEFLTFLDSQGQSLQSEFGTLPSFLLELCHYEWVELSLDVAVIDPEYAGPGAFTLDGDIVVNPCTRLLIYAYEVHKIGKDYQPTTPPSKPTYLIVYRHLDDEKVRFVESNPVTHRLIELLESQDVAHALESIRQELNAAGRKISEEQICSQGNTILRRLYDQGILLGSAVVANTEYLANDTTKSG